MRTLITLVVVLFCLQLWAQGYSQDTTIIDSLFAIPALDGDMAANTSGVAFSMNTTTYVFEIGDLGYPYDNCIYQLPPSIYTHWLFVSECYNPFIPIFKWRN